MREMFVWMHVKADLSLSYLQRDHKCTPLPNLDQMPCWESNISTFSSLQGEGRANLLLLPPCSPRCEPEETAGTFGIETELGVIKGHP